MFIPALAIQTSRCISMLIPVAFMMAFTIMMQSSSSSETDYMPEIRNTQMEPDQNRLPGFYTSDSAYDEFVNEYFMRHLSIDKRGIYTGGVMLGAVNHMWVVEWDWWMLPWIDRGAMGLARQGGNPSDVPLTTLVTCAVDKYGYTWGARPYPEAKNTIGSHIPTFGWPWPKYIWNRTVTQPTGWEFNDINDGFRDKWTSHDLDLQPGYIDFSLAGKIIGPRPDLISPKFDCDSFQIPIIELDITYKPKSGKDVSKRVDGLKIYWTTDVNPRFSESRMVTADFSTLPPKSFAVDYAPWVSGSEARYALYFPMHLHPEWGKGGRRITRLKIVPDDGSAAGDEVSINYIRASYDVRLSTTNATLINAAYKFYMWNGDDEFLKEIMPKLRKSITFMNEHLQGRKDKLLNFDWFAGHDGLGGDQPGHGLIGCYWDLLPAGRYDLESSYNYYYALKAMSELERVIERKKIDVSDISVIGPDNRSVISYGETSESLESLASKVKSQIEKTFWNKTTGRFVRNIDINGVKHDYGFLHHNLTALAFGIGTEKQRRSILSWMDGSRIVTGDTSTGKDIYHWRFAPRTTTLANKNYFFWPWLIGGREATPDLLWTREYGNQMQDGGAIPLTSLFDVMLRISDGSQQQIDAAYARTREVRQWFADVKTVGGEGTEFYRKYYDGHPERGRQQSPLPGGLGLDREFLSDASLGTEFLFYAFLGIDSREDVVITIRPAIPLELDKIGVTNVYYRGNHLKIEAGRDYVSLAGSKIPNGAGLKARIILRNVPAKAQFFADGILIRDINRQKNGSASVTVDLHPMRIEVR